MKRIHGLLTGLAASLLFCACGAGDEDAPSVGDPGASEDRTSEQAEAAQSSDGLDSDGQTADGTSGSCRAACTAISSTNLTGDCCSCNGLTKTFHRSQITPKLYLCY
jgi:hypothetical protein